MILDHKSTFNIKIISRAIHERCKELYIPVEFGWYRVEMVGTGFHPKIRHKKLKSSRDPLPQNFIGCKIETDFWVDFSVNKSRIF